MYMYYCNIDLKKKICKQKIWLKNRAIKFNQSYLLFGVCIVKIQEKTHQKKTI